MVFARHMVGERKRQIVGDCLFDTPDGQIVENAGMSQFDGKLNEPDGRRLTAQPEEANFIMPPFVFAIFHEPFFPVYPG